MNAARYRCLLTENLRNHRSKLLRQLKMSGELEEYLKEVSQQAEDRYNEVYEQLLHQEPLPGDHLVQEARRGQAALAADEIVRVELIQLPDPDTERAMRGAATKRPPHR